MRSADVAEKLSRDHPEWLRPHGALLLRLAHESRESAVRWHVVQMLPRLGSTRTGRRRVVSLLRRFLHDDSRLVRTFNMQALAELAAQDGALRPTVLSMLAPLTRTGSPAMRARGKMLLRRYDWLYDWRTTVTAGAVGLDTLPAPRADEQ